MTYSFATVSMTTTSRAMLCIIYWYRSKQKNQFHRYCITYYSYYSVFSRAEKGNDRSPSSPESQTVNFFFSISETNSNSNSFICNHSISCRFKFSYVIVLYNKSYITYSVLLFKSIHLFDIELTYLYDWIVFHFENLSIIVDYIAQCNYLNYL